MRPRLPFVALALCALVFATGCRTAAERPHVRSDVRTDKPTEGRPTLSMPITVPGRDLLVIPFTMDRAMTWVEDTFGTHKTDTLARSSMVAVATDGLPSGSGIASRVGNTLPGATAVPRPHALYTRWNVNWHNAVLERPEAGMAGLVLQQRGVITRFALLGQVTYDEEGHPATEVRAVLFTAVVEDTSGNGELNSQDSQLLLAADGEGNGLHAITPPGTQVGRMRYEHDTNRLYLLVMFDTDSNGLFTQADQSWPYVYTPGAAGVAQPVVDPQLIDQAESLLR